MNVLRQALQASPLLFPFQLDEPNDSVRFVRMQEQDYEQASFLDGRMLKPNTRFASIPWSELHSAAEGLSKRCHFIFHISHAGSTLLSRLLGSHPNGFSLREPEILRGLAQGRSPGRLDTFLGLWSRTFYTHQIAIIKATSFVNEIAVALMQRVPESRSVLMFIPPASFIPTMLDGVMSDIDDQAESRLMRLQKRGLVSGLALNSMSDGERVAMSWLAEMVSLSEVARLFAERVMWLDFEGFLSQPESQLGQILNHLQLPKTKHSLLASPIMQRYAKRPEVQYDSHFRTKLLEQSRQKFRDESHKGLEWLQQNAANISGLSSIVDFNSSIDLQP